LTIRIRRIIGWNRPRRACRPRWPESESRHERALRAQGPWGVRARTATNALLCF